MPGNSSRPRNTIGAREPPLTSLASASPARRCPTPARRTGTRTAGPAARARARSGTSAPARRARSRRPAARRGQRRGRSARTSPLNESFRNWITPSAVSRAMNTRWHDAGARAWTTRPTRNSISTPISGGPITTSSAKTMMSPRRRAAGGEELGVLGEQVEQRLAPARTRRARRGERRPTAATWPRAPAPACLGASVRPRRRPPGRSSALGRRQVDRRAAALGAGEVQQPGARTSSRSRRSTSKAPASTRSKFSRS